MALASSAGHHLFSLKTSHIPALSTAFADKATHVFGDDPEMSDCQKKPCPDIFLLALKRINATAAAESMLKPEECLVFEDSIAGVEAARRAGMRVVWVPHPGLARVCRGREADVLMGRTEQDGKVPEFCGNEESGDGNEVSGPKEILSEDGWAEMRTSLEDFPYGRYGVNVAS